MLNTLKSCIFNITINRKLKYGRNTDILNMRSKLCSWDADIKTAIFVKFLTKRFFSFFFFLFDKLINWSKNLLVTKIVIIGNIHIIQNKFCKSFFNT